VAIPLWQATGAKVAGSSSVAATVVWPAHTTNDIGLLVVETANQPVPTPAGWAVVTPDSGALGIGNAGGNTSTCLQVFWKRAASGAEGNVTIPTTDIGNHAVCYIITYRGVYTVGNPWDVAVADVTGGSITNPTFPAVTTTLADCLIVNIIGSGIDSNVAQLSGWTNATLASPAITEHADLFDAGGNGGGVAVADGGKATAGSSGSTTATTATAHDHAKFTIALRSLVKDISGAVNLSGTGSSTIVGSLNLSGAVALSGAGTSTIAGIDEKLGIAALSGNGSSTIAGVREVFGTTWRSAPTDPTQGEASPYGGYGLGWHSISGIRTVFGDTWATDPASPGLGEPSSTGRYGIGWYLISGTVTRLGAAALTGAGSSSVDGTVVPGAITGAAALSGSGTLTAAGTDIKVGAVNLTGTGTSFITSFTTDFGAADLTGVGSLTANGFTTDFGVTLLSGVGSMTVAGTRIVLGDAALTGVGSMTVAGLDIKLGAAALTGTGSMTVSGLVTKVATANLTGVGTLTASFSSLVSAAAALTGVGAMYVSWQPLQLGEVLLYGYSWMTVQSEMFRPPKFGQGVLQRKFRVTTGMVPDLESSRPTQTYDKRMKTEWGTDEQNAAIQVQILSARLRSLRARAQPGSRQRVQNGSRQGAK
jgi:hypothetical protein